MGYYATALGLEGQSAVEHLLTGWDSSFSGMLFSLILLVYRKQEKPKDNIGHIKTLMFCVVAGVRPSEMLPRGQSVL